MMKLVLAAALTLGANAGCDSLNCFDGAGLEAKYDEGVERAAVVNGEHFAQGKAAGLALTRTDGERDGERDGYDAGFSAGYHSAEGYAAGYADAYDDGATDGSDFRLYAAPSVGDQPAALDNVSFRGLFPEAIFAMPDGSIHILSDDGGVMVDGERCKDADKAKRSFRGQKLDLPASPK